MATPPTSLTYYGVNAYEALVNGIVADILLVMRSKRIPQFEILLKHGAIKAGINVVGTLIANYLPLANVNSLDVEYLSGAIAAAALSSMTNQSPTYAAGEQALISILSHMVSTRSVSAGLGYSWVNTALGNAGEVNLNAGSATNF
jgi:hypothetical protein